MVELNRVPGTHTEIFTSTLMLIHPTIVTYIDAGALESLAKYIIFYIHLIRELFLLHHVATVGVVWVVRPDLVFVMRRVGGEAICM